MQKNAATHPFNLDQIRVAAPCSADWDKMTGDDRVRFCGLCKKNVYNLSNMSRDEAVTLLQEKEGSVCTRFYRRPDGTVLTDNCPVGLRVIRNRVRWATVAASAALIAVGAFVGMRSAKAAGVSVRDVQPFKAMQDVQPVKALVDWLDPVLAKVPVPTPVMGAVQVRSRATGTPVPPPAPVPAPAQK